MQTPLERLDAAHDDAVQSSGPDFLRRLIDYFHLLQEGNCIRTVVDELRSEIDNAFEQLGREDDAFVADLVPIRRELVEREPDADDSHTAKPELLDPSDPQQSDQWHAWIWTLANFDAIADNRSEKTIEGSDLCRRARMMVSILNAKLHDLVFPFNEHPAPRPDLMDLYDRMNAVGQHQIVATRKVEKMTEETGYFALLHIERVVAAAEPDPRPLKTQDELRERAEEALTSPDLMRLPELLRPKETRGPFDIQELLALGRVEKANRAELERLHRPLQKRLKEASTVGRRDALSAPIRHFPAGTALLASIITVLLGGTAIVKFVFGLF